MKKTVTLFVLAVLAFCAEVQAQCSSSSSNYDLQVIAATTFGPNPTSLYMNGYVCSGGTLTDSMTCCTRLVHVDSGGTLNVGPLSYGMAYLKSGALFNGGGSSQNWMLYAEPGATIIGHTGTTVQCTTVTFVPAGCALGIAPQVHAAPVTMLVTPLQLKLQFAVPAEALTAELVDMNGRVIRSQPVIQTSSATIDLSGFAQGIYFCRVMKGNELLFGERFAVIR